MLKRFAQVSLVFLMVFAVASMVAAQTVAVDSVGANKKGSLLVFPLAQLNSGEDLNTYFFIGNDGANQDPINIKCYWMDGNQSVKNFTFELTHNQPKVFSADTAPNPFKDPAKGSLLCYAVQVDESTPIVWNHLYGYAALTDESVTPATYHFYNAYSFRVNSNGPDMFNDFSDGSGQLVLGGVRAYDKCQKYLVTNFIPYDDTATGIFTDAPDLTLWPCKQQVNQDRVPTYTKAKFDIWKYNEEKVTGAWKCIKCWWEGYLHQIDTEVSGAVWSRKGLNGANFLAATLGQGVDGLPPVARLRITGIASTVCNYGGVTSIPTGLLGVMVYADPTVEIEDPFVQPKAVHTLHGAGVTIDNGYIKVDVDPAGPVPEAPAQ